MSQKPMLPKNTNSLGLKLGILFFLLLLSGIPRLYVGGLISERRDYENTALLSVTQGWAARHQWGKARLTIPYAFATKDDKGKITIVDDQSQGVDPEEVRIVTTDEFEFRERGIYRIPVYRMHLTMTGNFRVPRDLAPGIQGERIRPGLQQLNFDSPSAFAVADFELLLNGEKHPLTRTNEGLRANLTENSFTPGDDVKFELRLELNGYGGVEFRSQTELLDVKMNSRWAHPSFAGQLPRAREVSGQGFTAEWRVLQPSENQQINVEFIEPVNIYTQSDRALKYGFLITLLCLSVLFLSETLWGLRIHPMQYLLFTLPLASFYVILIAFAEHVGFNAAYGVAAMAVIALLYTYLSGIGGNRKQSFGLAGLLAMVYGLILVMLASEDYALLIGAVCMFTCLATFMLLTRKLNWSKALPMEKDVHEQK